MTFLCTLHLFFIFFGTGSEVPTVMGIRNTVGGWTPVSAVHGYDCVGGAFWVCLHTQSEDGSSMS
jgi:hypothetical protein